ncbi:MAG: response regulator [Gammaproteobacteria bacterium]|nr:response regulator [Gammaproteobacteria bacterium]MBU1481915.1 response regulator [Gammaproteobacteria bacterium]
MEQNFLNRELRILMLEDTPSDAELAEHELRKDGIAFTSMRVETRAAFIDALEQFQPDIVLSDYNLPDFNGMAAIQIVQREHPEVPVVMVTGALSDVEAVELIHAGARDYVLKDRLARLAPAVQRALAMERDLRARKAAEQALRKSHDELEERVRQRTAELTNANTQLQAEKAAQEELIGKLAEAHSQLLQSEKMASIGQLASGVAHEINNPIGFVNSNMGSLQRYMQDLLKLLSEYENAEQQLPEETRAALAGIKQQVDVAYLRNDVANLLSESMEGLQRVKHIVQDLKDFSHVDKQEKQWASLEQGLDSTLNIVWNELKYKADVVKEYAGIPQIECIPAQLNQVFMNLLMNAVQAIDEHGRITIRTGTDGDDVWVEVEDSGRGIEPEHLSRIFDPFFTTKPVGSGTGLGLSLSYSIVQDHGGRIEVKSAPGQGSVFRVVLPLHAAAA